VGGGIAALAAAVFLIRDADVSGEDIVLFEQRDRLGGSLDGSGDAETGYLVRGGRMFEEHFSCTFDLLASIPATEAGGPSIRDDIAAFNREVRGSSLCRLVRQGRRADPAFGLGARDLADLARLMLAPERSLQARTIESCFRPAFFETNFWLMWSTTFAFQTWHSALELRRYFRRFMHLLPGFKRLEGVLRTRHNQYDSLIAPIVAWLRAKGVRMRTNARVVDVGFRREGDGLSVTSLVLTGGGEDERIGVGSADRVYLTLGSMTEGAALGSNTAAPAPSSDHGAWDFWRRLAAREPDFGRPEAFCGDAARTRWESFTVTLGDPAFFGFMERFTGNEAGTGGLVTFADSSWRLSIVLFRQPHFVEQPPGVFVFWGYGLRPDRAGDFVAKPMAACSGAEIVAELAGHLGLADRGQAMFADAKVISCLMPFVTSQFMPRRRGDRPAVVPKGARNFAVIGQFCEMPDDVVFTVEYSVRSAWAAVHALTGKGRPPPPARRMDREPAIVWGALRALLTG
jgi:oleate hydratase